MTTGTEIEKREQGIIQESPEAMIARIRNNQQVVRDIMKGALRDNEHYGTIPGAGKKKVLMKSGAEVMSFTFRLDPEYEIKIVEMENGHRDYQVTCTIYSIETGKRQGSASGSCSTMESKYRYRNSSDYEITGKPIPKDAKEKKQEYRKQGYGMKPIDGKWEWVKFASERVENKDIADVYNTVLKMAQKRAFVAAILTVLSVSDMFTQDLEDGIDGNEETGPDEPFNPATGEIIETPDSSGKPEDKTPQKPVKTPEDSLKILKESISDLRFLKITDEEKIKTAKKYKENWLRYKFSKTILDEGERELNQLLANLGVDTNEEELF